VVLLALISGFIALAAVVAGVVVVFVRTRELLRGFRSFGGSLNEATARLEAASMRLAERPDSAGPERLSASLERLARSRARLAVLTTALAEVGASVTRVRAVVPRK
jgi:hypothetical protein